jgi:glutamate-5-semialdehyde dehydrogenase
MPSTDQSTGTLTALTAGMPIPFGGNRVATVSPELADAFAAGDDLHVVQRTGALLHVPAAVRELVTEQVDQAVAAFAALRTTPAEQVRDFYRAFARRLVEQWEAIARANEEDVARARGLGRSTTRLGVNQKVRDSMAAGLEGWAAHMDALLAGAEDGALTTVDHGDWSVQVRTAPLGVIGFVFEGRPNVFADACGVLATGNTAVLRIGSDALGTARAILEGALEPALADAGLPAGAVRLVPSLERSAGWALFNDPRLALAVVRGSGRAVTELSAVARQAGIPVSAHGTGGAWLVADASADAERLAAVVENSLDRKVCNTLNVAVVLRDRAEDLVPVILAAADAAARRLVGGDTGEVGASTVGGGGGAIAARLHVAQGSESWIPSGEFDRVLRVLRAEGEVDEVRAEPIGREQLGTEWEWEGTPELSFVVVDSLEEAAELFNAHSPRFVASLISEDVGAHERFAALVDAPFVGDGFTRLVDGQYALDQPELGLSNWENGRLLGRSGILTGADLTSRRVFAHHEDPQQRR